jgi:hypothetical protein
MKLGSRLSLGRKKKSSEPRTEPALGTNTTSAGTADIDQEPAHPPEPPVGAGGTDDPSSEASEEKGVQSVAETTEAEGGTEGAQDAMPEEDGVEDGEADLEMPQQGADTQALYTSSTAFDPETGMPSSYGKEDVIEEEVVDPVDQMTGRPFPDRFLETPPVMTDPNDTIELGYFMKQAQSGMNWKERYFFLDTWHHKLIYYENKDDARRASTQKPMKEFHLLPGTRIEIFSKPPQHTNGLVLKIDGGKELRISAKDSSMRDIALAQISKTLGDRGNNMLQAEAQASSMDPQKLVGCKIDVVGAGKALVVDFHKSMFFSANKAEHSATFERGGTRKVLLRRNDNNGMRFVLQESAMSMGGGSESGVKRTHSALTQRLRDLSHQNAAVISEVSY